MAVDFHHIVPGIGVRSAHVDGQHLVYNIFSGRVLNPAVIHLMACIFFLRMARMEELFKDLKRVLPADPDNPDPAWSRRSSDCGNGGFRLFRHHSGNMISFFLF